MFRVEDGEKLGHTRGVFTDLAFAPDGHTLYLSDGEDIRGRRVGQDEMGPPLVFGARTDTCGMAFSPASGLLSTGSTDGGVFIWNLRDGTPAGVLLGPTDAVTDVEFSSDGTLLASGFIDATVRLRGIR